MSKQKRKQQKTARKAARKAERKAEQRAAVQHRTEQVAAKLRGDEKVMRLAHEILTKKIWPANLSLDEAIDVVAVVAKALVLSNTADDDPAARADMIMMFEERFAEVLADIYPADLDGDLDGDLEADGPFVWLVPPQGRITEPVGILWDGSHAENSVDVVLGTDLLAMRSEISEMRDDEDGPCVIEGIDGLAIIDPEWDGAETVTCANPECGEVHNVHLRVAENLFAQAKQRAEQREAPN